MLKLQKELNMGVILITHDLGVVAEVCSRVLVMYLGQIVEECPVDSLFENPLHPYTCGLIRSIPSMETNRREALHVIEGSVPSLYQIPAGCHFCSALSPRRPPVSGSTPISVSHCKSQSSLLASPSYFTGGRRLVFMTTQAAPLLEIKQLVKHFTVSRGYLQSPRSGQGSKRCFADDPGRRDLRAGGRIWLRQEHDRPVGLAADRADRR